MLVVWQGRGWWVTWLAALAMFLPIILLRQVDGPEVDRGVAITMSIAAVVTLWLGIRWNRGIAPAPHSLWGVPMQIWAFPMLLFAVLLGTGTITTAEEPRPSRAARPAMDGGLK
jgi:hypothetical protein